MKKTLLGTVFFLLTLSGQAQLAQDEKLIKEAIQNYVEAFHEVDTLKVYDISVLDLAKKRYYKDGQIKEVKIFFEPIESLAQTIAANQKVTAATPAKIIVFEVLDKIAAAKVEAKKGVNYFHLKKKMESG